MSLRHGSPWSWGDPPNSTTLPSVGKYADDPSQRVVKLDGSEAACDQPMGGSDVVARDGMDPAERSVPPTSASPTTNGSGPKRIRG